MAPTQGAASATPPAASSGSHPKTPGFAGGYLHSPFRIESDAKTRARAIQKEQDARLRLIARLEAIAYSDPRDIAQWDRKPEFDRKGNIKGWNTEIEVTPSRLLTPEQAAQVKIVTTKSGGLKFEVVDRLQALAQLAKILGLTVDTSPQPVSSTYVNVSQVNVIGADNALEAARRLAFALEKAARAAQAAPLLDVTSTHDGSTERASASAWR